MARVENKKKCVYGKEKKDLVVFTHCDIILVKKNTSKEGHWPILFFSIFFLHEPGHLSSDYFDEFRIKNKKRREFFSTQTGNIYCK